MIRPYRIAKSAKGSIFRPAMYEEGLVTLAKIVGLLVFCMAVVPLMFMGSPGADKREPEDVFDTD